MSRILFVSRIRGWFRSIPARSILAVLLIVGAGHLGWQAYRASFVFPADARNPYAYVQPPAGIARLANHLQGLAETSQHGWEVPVKVIWTDAYYWPLPWYLRRFEDVELWRSMPDDPVASVVIAAAEYDVELTGRLGKDYIMTGHYELRPQVLMQLWVSFDFWESYLRRIGRID